MSNDPIRLADRVNYAIHLAVTDVMNSYAADLPELSWSAGYGDDRVSGCAGYSSYANAAEVLLRWADRFGLALDQARPGIVAYTGTIDDQFVRVWGVVDQAAYQAGIQELRAGRVLGANR